jgi:hypothetical protein
MLTLIAAGGPPRAAIALAPRAREIPQKWRFRWVGSSDGSVMSMTLE